MKTLVLLRHAKSAWDSADLPDIDRPLSPRGQKAAPLMGERLKKAGYVPDLVLCSTAKRAQETLDLIAASLPKKAKVQHLKELYMAVPREMLNVVVKVADGAVCANTWSCYFVELDANTGRVVTATFTK